MSLQDLGLPLPKSMSEMEIIAPPHYDSGLAQKFSHSITSIRSGGRILKCEVPIGNGYRIQALSYERLPGKIFIDAVYSYSEYGYKRDRNSYWSTHGFTVETVEPFIGVKVVSIPIKRSHLQVTSHGWQKKEELVEASYQCPMNARSYGRDRDRIMLPYLHANVLVKMLDGSGEVEVELRFERPDCGEIDLSRQVVLQRAAAHVNLDFFGRPLYWMFDIQDYHNFHRVLSSYSCKQGTDALWAWWLAHRPLSTDLTGVKAIESRKNIKEILTQLSIKEPLLYRFFQWLHNGKVYEKTSNNKLLAAMLESITGYEDLVSELRRVMTNVPNTVPIQEYSGGSTNPARNICLSLKGATEKISETKAKAQWQYAKGARAQAETLGISAERHPLLMARVEAGDLSFNLLHEAGSEDKLINIEFDLWEKSLSRKGWAEPLVEIAGSASRRTTYSKRVTSYFAFLFRIEKYLDKHAPLPQKNKKKVGWKAMPKFVSSQWELEMAEATEEGTTKKRSAMTPVADNETGIITVPYVAMAVSGVRTTWCYSEIYFVAEEGQEDPIFPAGGVYSSDLVEKLNGRDDYGLCFFTLTGTSRNQGYPTFLIIFERTTGHGTHVHFHRVHPSRSRGPNGTDTPPCRLIEETYRYMAGNIRAEQIRHQQGDLLLVSADGPGKSTEEPVRVRGFENHEFVSRDPLRPVTLTKATGKSRGNLLGWLYAPAGMRMPHPEHEPIEGIEPGWYELRRCKSWEANPTSVWVLNID